MLDLAAGSIRSSLAWGTEQLVRAGCDSPRLDAELLLATALDTTRTALFVGLSDPVPDSAASRFGALVAARAGREPVAYLLGRKEFRRLSLTVDRRVLIPRPETELLVEVGLELPRGARVADVGTGSGAIALALKDERPDLVVAGIERSADALAVARENAARLELEVELLHGDLLAGGSYDAVLANLPYVAAGSVLEPEIALYEPPAALFAGDDGLDVVRELIVEASAAAVPLVALEIGAGQAPVVARLLSDAGFASVEPRRDLAGHERVLVARW